jgi:ELWxxDGT repeat protein
VNGKILVAAVFDCGDETDLWGHDRSGDAAVALGQWRKVSRDPLGAASGRLYFGGSDYPDGRYGLWKTDGTPGGTVVVTEELGAFPLSTATGTCELASSPKPGPAPKVPFFFAGYDGTHGIELWKSDGSAEGTMMIVDATPGRSSSGNHTMFRDVMYFTADDGVHGHELWRSDGTAEGTALVKDLEPGAGSSDRIGFFTGVGDTLFFFARRSGMWRLWRTDGTADGTAMLKELQPELQPETGYTCTLPLKDKLLILARRVDAYGRELGQDLWSSDGTPDGTVRLHEFPTVTWPFALRLLLIEGDDLFFQGWDPGHGYELWKTDGTTDGTGIVKDIHPGPSSSGLSRAVAIDGTLYFSADDGAAGVELWKSDGTEVGTVMVRDLDPTGSGLTSDGPAEVKGALLFSATDGNGGRELWTSDGTAEGTVKVQEIRPGPRSSNPQGFAVAGTRVFFTADDGVHGRELWAGYAGILIRKPEVAVRDLTTDLEALGVHDGIHQSLKAKLNRALAALGDSKGQDRRGAVNALDAFIHEVEAQRGKKIAPEQADTLIDFASQAVELLQE